MMLQRIPIPAWRGAGVLISCALLLLSAHSASAQPTPAAPSAAAVEEGSDAAILARLSQLRDDFIGRVGEVGYKPCAAPAIELGDPPSFGHYLAKSNTVQISAWAHLSEQEKKGFEDMAQRTHGEASARSVFENGTYRWVFVHELGHWWQGCQHKMRPRTYAGESGANRIALAYWHEVDPRFAGGIVRGFRGLVNSRPSPVPAGQSPQHYLDSNFTKILHSDDYVWFQGKMVADLAEMAPPSFHEALSKPLYPK